MKSQSKRKDPHDSQAKQEGRSATRISDNPYTKGTPAYREWKRGFAYASHVKNTIPKPNGNVLGVEAAKLGRDKTSCPFEDGSKAYTAWMRSYNREKTSMVYREGLLAYKPDFERPDNPYQGSEYALEWDKAYSVAKSQYERYGNVYLPSTEDMPDIDFERNNRLPWA